MSSLIRYQIILYVIFSKFILQITASISLRQNYFGFPLAADFTFSAERVSKVMSGLECGNATDINGLTAEH